MSKKIKLVIWDLDNTLWNGVISEDTEVKLREEIPVILKELDNRGILQSITSKNNFDDAIEQLKKFGIDQYFIYPMINWNSKSESIEAIIKNVNILADTVAFVDDYEFELDEVKFRLPQVTCINSTDLTGFLERDEMNPLYITEDSRVRRSMYQSDIIRKQVEESYTGTKEDFLASLGMKMTVSYAQENDLRRAEELTVRTHQLNSTGYTYSYDELKEFISSDNYKLLIVDLTDRYGYYGKIGLILLHCEKQVWTIKLLITSCRVMSRGIGKILLSLLVNISIDKGVKLLAEYIQNDRNRIMGVTYSLTGFHSCGDVGSKNMLEYTAGVKIPIPSYIEVEVEMQSAVGEMSYPVQV